jgi:hypothetical protein
MKLDETITPRPWRIQTIPDSPTSAPPIDRMVQRTLGW